MAQLLTLTRIHKPDVIMVKETWFGTESITTLDSDYNEYKFDRCEVNNCERSRQRGGGVCIYVHVKIKSLEITDCDLKVNAIEKIWCTIESNCETILKGCIKRPHDTSEMEDTLINRSISNDKYLL